MSAKFRQKSRFFLPFSIKNMINTRVLVKGVLRTFGVGLKGMMDARAENIEQVVTPINLAVHVAGYHYNAEKFEKLEDALFKKIRDYDPKYGAHLESHLKRTSGQLARVLKAKGYGDEDIIKIQQAFMLHDIGKIAQAPSLWQLSLEKPSEAKKLERSEHVHLARGVIEQTIEELKSEFGLDFSSPDDALHLQTIFYMAKTHHERLNGRGPLGWTSDDLDLVMRIAAIIDEIDGKLKLVKDLEMKVPTDEDSIMAELFIAIKVTKHDGEFDQELIEFCKTVLADEAAPEVTQSPTAPIPSAIAFTPVS